MMAIRMYEKAMSPSSPAAISRFVSFHVITWLPGGIVAASSACVSGPLSDCSSTILMAAGPASPTASESSSSVT